MVFTMKICRRTWHSWWRLYGGGYGIHDDEDDDDDDNMAFVMVMMMMMMKIWRSWWWWWQYGICDDSLADHLDVAGQDSIKRCDFLSFLNGTCRSSRWRSSSSSSSLPHRQMLLVGGICGLTALQKLGRSHWTSLNKRWELVGVEGPFLAPLFQRLSPQTQYDLRIKA